MTTSEIIAAFDRLDSRAQLYLIDALADRLGYASDEFVTACQAAAHEIAEDDVGHAPSIYDDRAYNLADAIYPQGSPLPGAWKAFRVERDAALGGVS